MANNLLGGSPVRVETKSPVRLEGNVARDVTRWLVDPAAGNLHLRPGAAEVLGTVERLPEVPEDIDRQKRPERTAVGADQPAGDKPTSKGAAQ